ncbi:MAG TPA: class I SAM-dependent methyltransferase [Thermomicrobiales bacterium]
MDEATEPTASALLGRLDTAIRARADLFDPAHQAAFRLLNGFLEGAPDLAIDLYARTIVIHDYATPAEPQRPTILAVIDYLREQLPWLRAIILKCRHAADQTARRGLFAYGAESDRQVREHGIRYALDLTMHRDTSLYLDTRGLRDWARRELGGQTVLNTFAYTGSLGVAARAGGATRVVQLDRNRDYLDVARASYALNAFPITRGEFRAGDFFAEVGRMKRAGERFDCAFIDPPFFTATKGGTVDLVAASHRPINRIRPLVANGGRIVAINNALFVSGSAWLDAIEALCVDGYLAIEDLIAVPPDFTGYPETRAGLPPADPAPFNHSTKIVVLRVRHKEHSRRSAVRSP